MKDVYSNQIRIGNKEEIIPDYTEEFPYRASRMHFENYGGDFVPWHWHKALEMFYIESGAMECDTPSGSVVFEQGTAGLVNSNIMHSTRSASGSHDTIQYVHLFGPDLIGGKPGSRIYSMYLEPVVSNACVELIKLIPDGGAQSRTIGRIRESFQMDLADPYSELEIRNRLSEIWLDLCRLKVFSAPGVEPNSSMESNLKLMMLFINENLEKKMTTEMIAEAGFTSERGCFRAFREYLHTTPGAYINQCRIVQACRMLTEENYSIAQIAAKCGFKESSHFGRVFRDSRCPGRALNRRQR